MSMNRRSVLHVQLFAGSLCFNFPISPHPKRRFPYQSSAFHANTNVVFGHIYHWNYPLHVRFIASKVFKPAPSTMAKFQTCSLVSYVTQTIKQRRGERLACSTQPSQEPRHWGNPTAADQPFISPAPTSPARGSNPLRSKQTPTYNSRR